MRFPRACVLVAASVSAIVAESRAAATPAAAVASGEVLLLDFSAPWCGPCRQMAPLLGEVEAAGWPVRHVDVDRELDLVRRFGVTGVPSYVLLVKGQEIGRINGATTRGELEKLLAQAAAPLGGTALPSSSPSPAAVAGTPVPAAPATRPLATEPAVRTPPAEMPPAARVSREAPPPAAQPIAAVAPAASMPAGEREQLERRLMNATARIRVEDARGISWGTGTVIDCRQGEALILTCGHIFRDSQGKGRIEVDTFAPRGPRGIAGQVVSWDLKRDLALVSIFTESAIEPVRVGAADRRTTAGDAVVTVGCDGGSDPTIHHSRVTAVDKYLGPANVQVAGQPVQGRSGGGLFAIDGTLIGVCNAADPSDNEGLFAALPAIHEQLEESGLAFVYRNVYPSGGADSVAVAGGSAHVPAMPAEMPPVSFDRRDRADAVPTASTTQTDPRAAAATPGAAVSPGEQALIEHVRQHGGRAEVICIVRAAEGASEVFVLKDAGRDFVGRLSEAHHGTATPPRGGAATRSDVATLPPAGPSR